MTDLRLVVSAINGQFAEAMKASNKPIASAATATMKDVAKIVKTQGRSKIAAAGFSRKWQNALRVNVYPDRGTSTDAAALAFHKIPYAGVFENGATIGGKPLLWLPLPNVPARIGGRAMTPRVFVELIGPLHSINVPGKPPMLAGYVSINADTTKLTVSKLRTGNNRRNRKAAVKSVPVFFGVSTVQLRARFGLQAIFNSVRSSLALLYASHVRSQ